MPVEGSSSSDKAESSSSASKPRLDKSKTERQQQKEKVAHILAEDAAKIFDDRLSAGKKVQNILFLGFKSSIFSSESLFFFFNVLFFFWQLKLLNRLATVKHDGTVEFEVPADVIPQAIAVDREEDSKNGVCPDESIDGVDLQYIPPMQIVMLIVGTRGDVQPFVAIAKRLQVWHISY